VHNVSDVRQIELHTAVPLVPGLSSIEVEIAIAKLKGYKSQSSDIIPVELIQGGGEILLSTIHNHINSILNVKELPDQRKKSIIVPFHKKGHKTEYNNYRGISLLSTSYNILSHFLLSRLCPYIYY
jgi:hypothetical protein